MDREEVTKWLTIIKANLNSFPEVSNAKKIEALAEAIRLLKNEQSIDKIDCEHTECRNCTNHKYCDYEISSSEKPNKSIEEKCPCYDCEYFVIDGLSHCKIYEGVYGDCRCKNYHKVNQDLTKVKQDLTKVKQGLNRSEIPTGSDDCISREQAIKKADDLTFETGYDNEKVEEMLKELTSITPIRMLKELPSITPIRPKGHWIETAEEYYKAINEKGGGVNESTDYFTDDIACSECLAKFSVIENEADRFDFCPCCGSDNR